MSLSAQDQNIISEIMNTSESLVTTYHDLRDLITRFNVNDIYNHATDQALAENATFAHLVQGEVGNAIAAFTAITDAIETNSNLEFLLKTKG